MTEAEWARIERVEEYTVTAAERRQVEDGDIGEPSRSPLWDWRRFLPDYTRERWHELNDAGKLCAFVAAKNAAERDADDPRWDE